VRSSALLLAVMAGLLTGCVTAPPGPPPPPGSAAVARDSLYLTLPLPPGFPEEREMAQSVVADYGPRKVAFDALVSLSPDRVIVIVTAPAGPRIARIDWTKDGVAVQTEGPPPPGFRAENVLADLVLANWPKAAVETAINDRLLVWDFADGRRKLVREGAGRRELVIDITAPVADGDGSISRVLTNHDFGYSLTLVTREAM
jgi:hypothetical protein